MEILRSTNECAKRPMVPREVMKRLSSVSPYKSIALCVLIYLATLVLAYIGGRGSGYFLSPFAILIIAGLQNHLLILFHEGSHWMVHPNRKWNDFFTDVFCGAPLLQFVRNYRVVHWSHHRNTGNEGLDPEIEIYKGQDFQYVRRSFRNVIWMLFKDLFLWNLVRFQISFYRYVYRQAAETGHKVTTAREIAIFALIWVPVIGLCYQYNLFLDLVLFWLLPLFTVTFLLLKLHVYGEHTGLDGPLETDRTWFHRLPFWVDFLVYPIRSGFHIEHHLFPSIPWYSLSELRSELEKNPSFVERSDRATLDGIFFGKRTVFTTMLWGAGKYTDGESWRLSHRDGGF